MSPGSEAAEGQGENKKSYSEASTPRVYFLFKARFFVKGPERSWKAVF